MLSIIGQRFGIYSKFLSGMIINLTIGVLPYATVHLILYNKYQLFHNVDCFFEVVIQLLENMDKNLQFES